MSFKQSCRSEWKSTVFCNSTCINRRVISTDFSLHLTLNANFVMKRPQLPFSFSESRNSPYAVRHPSSWNEVYRFCILSPSFSNILTQCLIMNDVSFIAGVRPSIQYSLNWWAMQCARNITFVSKLWTVAQMQQFMLYPFCILHSESWRSSSHMMIIPQQQHLTKWWILKIITLL